MTTNTNLPRQLPQIPSELLDQLDPNLRAVLEPIIEWILIGQGSTGNSLDHLVTRRDLWQAGVVDIQEDNGDTVIYNGVPDNPGLSYSPPGGSSFSGNADDLVIGIPTTPTGLTTRGTEEHVMLFWDSPDYLGHSQTEVWRASTNSLAAAVLVATVPLDTRAWADDLGSSGITRYYWVRHTNIDGVDGNYNAGEAGGTAGTTTATPSTTTGYAAFDGADIVHARMVSAYIADAAITNAKIANATIEGGKIAAGTITADKYSQLRNSIIINGEDSVDSTYPLIVQFPVLGEVETNGIVAARLSVSYQPFRAYSQAGSTSAGGESLTSGDPNQNVIPLHNHAVVTQSGSSTYNLLYESNNFYYVNGSDLGTLTFNLQNDAGHQHSVNVLYGGTTQGSKKNVESQLGDLRTDGGGSVTSNTSEGHTHTITLTNSTVGSNVRFNNGTTILTLPSATDAGEKYTSSVGTDHDHGVTTSNHTHSVNFGIYEEDNTASLVSQIQVSNNLSPTYQTVKNPNPGKLPEDLLTKSDETGGHTLEFDIIDVTDQDILNGAGWKLLKITSTHRCRVIYMIELKLDITA